MNTTQNMSIIIFIQHRRTKRSIFSPVVPEQFGFAKQPCDEQPLAPAQWKAWASAWRSPNIPCLAEFLRLKSNAYVMDVPMMFIWFHMVFSLLWLFCCWGRDSQILLKCPSLPSRCRSSRPCSNRHRAFCTAPGLHKVADYLDVNQELQTLNLCFKLSST